MLVAATLALPQVTIASTVKVRVLGVSGDAVCPRAFFLKPTCPHVGHAPAHAGDVVVVIEGVPEGTYAVQAHHDINGNGRIDTTFLGVPREGIGFSRDAAFRFGPPSFADAAVSISGEVVALDITLKFEPR